MKQGMIDFHCDVLAKLLTGEADSFRGSGAEGLDVTYERLQQADALLQTFAVYIPEQLESSVHNLLRAVDHFYQHILTCPNMMFVRSSAELHACAQAGRTGAVLAIEGADALQGDMALLRLLQRLGVRSLGLTWNHANWAADGILEPRSGGLTGRGRELVRLCNELGILVDVSHLSERSFWDTVDRTAKPVIASHSNVRTVCSHPRNLTDEQIKAIIMQGGLIGVTYVPWFVKHEGSVRTSDLLRHIDYICELGGEDNIMFGSDFDGIGQHIEDLAHPGDIPAFMNELYSRYGKTAAHKWIQGNAFRFLAENLPEA
ncbi:membrane dipeptidase [Paenibacillus sambharensis]|uniref:Membrane dipeptidase n=1 Tax=Paenibacillus sambharensis TaxID=1803190 RepID=A0A2W1LEB0_9BACL|nr:dipeptidase [Paenibacillus sambharensis]PZD93392.1 membrane dipeptidase [Paenibacillus sambharensis]